MPSPLSTTAADDNTGPAIGAQPHLSWIPRGHRANEFITPALAARVRRTRDVLAGRVVEQVGADGAVREPTRSRVLESALLLTLLRQTDRAEAAQRRLVRYISNQQLRCREPAGGADDAAVLEAAIADAVLDRHHDRSVAVVRNWLSSFSWLNSFSHANGTRKYVVLNALFALLGIAPADIAAPDCSDITYRGFATWTEQSLCAAKIIASREPYDVLAADEAFLLNALSSRPSGEVVECNVLAHLMMLFALHRLSPQHPLVHSGIETLVGRLNPDGGAPFLDHATVVCTPIAGMALLGMPGAAQLLTRMGDYTAAHQSPDGGWGYSEGVRQTETDTTFYCMAYLRALDPWRYRNALTKAEEYLHDIANSDGGFPTHLRGQESEITTTAGAILCLPATTGRHAETVHAAIDYLLSAQQPDGTLERSWSLCESYAILRSVFALHSRPDMTQDQQRRANSFSRRAIEYLISAQNHDGGWGQTRRSDSDVLSTAYALPVIRYLSPNDRAASGLRYLLDQQLPDGTFTSVPDQTGPRPLPYDLPSVPNLFTLHTLTHCLPFETIAPQPRPAPSMEVDR
jgi:squalene-hopene/tetraprenyl-beta-curcumene cyclase